jgi:pimeloyl-ACP methyl ester carboxylesterase
MLRRPWTVEDELLHLLFSRPMRELDPAVLREFVRMVGQAPATRWASIKQYVGILRFDARDRLRGLRAPTLVITGDHDLMVAPANAEVLAREIPDARLVQIRGGAHALLRPFAEELDRLVHGFLAEAAS